MPPPKPAYDVDWVFSNNSNVHVANHLDWFISYEPFLTTFNSGLGDGADGAGAQVFGIGDVELPTKTHPTRAGAAYQGTILLRNVLYAPSAFCNILGSPLFNNYSYTSDSGAGISKITSKTTGACVGLLDNNILFRLRLRGQSAKQSSLKAGMVYFIRANWPSSEIARWKASRAEHGQEGHASFTETDKDGPHLTDFEKKWLKDHYGSEFHFLRSHGLSIYEDEDRAEGRRILRALMDAESGSDEDSLNSFERDLVEDPSSHAADYHFSPAELDWIKANYGHSANFLLSYGLKFYNDEDCQEGKQIVRALIGDSD